MESDDLSDIPTNARMPTTYTESDWSSKISTLAKPASLIIASRSRQEESLDELRAAVLNRSNIILSAIDLANTIMGTGILSIPYGFSMVGLGFGTILVIGSMIATWFSLQLLVSAANYASSKPGTHSIRDNDSATFIKEENDDLLYPTISASLLDLSSASKKSLDKDKRVRNDVDSKEPRRTYFDPRESVSSVDSLYLEDEEVSPTPQSPSIRNLQKEDTKWDDIDEHEWSYGWLAMKTWKSRRKAVWTDIAILLSTLGFAVSYLVSIGDVMPEAIQDAFPDGWNVSSATVLHSGHFWIVLFLLLTAPITFSEGFDGFGWFGLSALACALFEAGVVICGGMMMLFTSSSSATANQPSLNIGKDIQWFIFKWDAVGTIPIFTFAFTCHQNIFGIYKDIKHRFDAHDPRLGPYLVKHVRITIDYAVIGVGLLYLVVGSIGYLAFGSSTKVIILDNFPPSIYIILARILFSYLAAISFPVQVHPVRESILNILSLCGMIPKNQPVPSRANSANIYSFANLFHDHSENKSYDQRGGQEYMVVDEKEVGTPADEMLGMSSSTSQFFLTDLSLSTRNSRSTPSGLSAPNEITPISRKARTGLGTPLSGGGRQGQKRSGGILGYESNPAVQTNLFVRRWLPFWLRPFGRLLIHFFRGVKTIFMGIYTSAWLKNETDRRITLSFIITVISFLITWFVTNLDDIITFVGATSGVLVCYILPALLYRSFVMKPTSLSSASSAYFQNRPDDELDEEKNMSPNLFSKKKHAYSHRQWRGYSTRKRAWWKSCVALQLAIVGALSGIFNLYWLLSRSATPTESRQVQPKNESIVLRPDVQLQQVDLKNISDRSVLNKTVQAIQL